MVISIPGLCWVLDFYKSNERFHSLSLIHLLISLAMYILLPAILFPWGVFVSKTFKGKVLNPRLGTMLSHISAPLIFLYMQFYYPNGYVFSLPSCLFLSQYLYRCIVYPFFKKSYARPIPLRTIMFNAAISFHFGFCSSRMIIFNPSTNYLMNIFLSIAFIALGILGAIHDWIICSARKPDPQAYDIVNKWGFKWVTCPQYGCQAIQWMLYTSFADNLPDWGSCIVYVGYLLLVRADLIHHFMLRTIPQYQFLQKFPAIPFVRSSKFFLN